MSTLNVDTINDRVGTGQPAISGLAKAWVNFNGTGTVAIRASYNVSSITDNGAGDYTVNFTTAMSDANYGITCSTSANFGIAGTFVNFASDNVTEAAPTTTTVRLQVNNFNDADADAKYVSVSIFR